MPRQKAVCRAGCTLACSDCVAGCCSAPLPPPAWSPELLAGSAAPIGSSSSGGMLGAAGGGAGGSAAGGGTPGGPSAGGWATGGSASGSSQEE
eukprot:13637469-Alexandrium_andersonii.AAC.1